MYKCRQYKPIVLSDCYLDRATMIVSLINVGKLSIKTGKNTRSKKHSKSFAGNINKRISAHMYYIGIDIGTTSVCGVLYDAVTSHTESITISNDSILSSKELDERLQNPERIYEIVESILTRFINSGKEIGAIDVYNTQLTLTKTK